MGNLKPDGITNTDMTNTVTDYSSTNQNTSFESYMMPWSKWYGKYKEDEDLQAIIDKKAMWTVGKGWKADPATTKQLKKIRGNGKDTFNTILENTVKVYTIGGDSFAEIIRSKRGPITNLKPLNPGTMTVVSNKHGIIDHYEQSVDDGKGSGKTSTNKKNIIFFKPEQILHLPWNRIADSNHGQSTIEKIEKAMNAKQEARNDMRTVFHRYVKPLLITSVDTDDESEIKSIKQKLDNAVENGENLVIPKDTVDTVERVSIPQFSTLDPLPWIKYNDQALVKAEGVPSVILGVGDESTEATSKILYLAYQQTIEWNQKFVTEQFEAQTGLVFELEFPASLEPLLFDQQQKQKSMNNPEMGHTGNK